MSRGTGKKLAVVALIVVLAVCAVALCAPVGLLLLPAFLLAVPLFLGRYPGEDLIARIARRTHTAPVARRPRVPRAPHVLGARRAPLAALGASRAPPCAA